MVVPRPVGLPDRLSRSAVLGSARRSGEAHQSSHLVHRAGSLVPDKPSLVSIPCEFGNIMIINPATLESHYEKDCPLPRDDVAHSRAGRGGNKAALPRRQRPRPRHKCAPPCRLYSVFALARCAHASADYADGSCGGASPSASCGAGAAETLTGRGAVR